MAGVSGWPSSSDDSDEDIVLAVIISNKSKKRKRKEWVNEVCCERKEFGQFETLVKRNLSTDEDKFFNYFRMTPHQYGTVLSLVKDDIKKCDTRLRKTIPAEERLSICLRYLSTGDSYPTMYFAYRVGKSTICTIISEVCQAIWKNLKEEHIPIPSRAKWEEIAEEFDQKWNFPPLHWGH
ncbi:protein ANTAGONIST OF LIKE HETEROCHROMATIN PROTEIN 1-like [Anneissia japonica]|uniref:protein ANTAGONIST OF LIKE HETEROCHROMATIN PROTEIN 1-like n=1 Tax=Anneissia japonica TaxID=1529436 RepID=UPI00142562DD|nr:protein ANTAGONIST OF LIKE HETEROCHROMATIN PROTEIN 1-like [Anneissia japonica]